MLRTASVWEFVPYIDQTLALQPGTSWLEKVEALRNQLLREKRREKRAQLQKPPEYCERVIADRSTNGDGCAMHNIARHDTTNRSRTICNASGEEVNIGMTGLLQTSSTCDWLRACRGVEFVIVKLAAGSPRVNRPAKAFTRSVTSDLKPNRLGYGIMLHANHPAHR